MVKLTQDLLIDAGGWQVLKEARGIQAAGRVSDAKYAPPTLLGLVKGSGTEFRSGLRIQSPTDIENLCTCMESRRRGVICAHSIAVALEVMQPSAKPAQAVAVAVTVKATPPPATPSPFSTSGPGQEIELHLIFPPNFPTAWEKKSIMVVVEAVTGNQRKPFATIDPKRQWKCDGADLRFLNAFLPIVSGKPASMAMLTCEQCSEILSALVDHPRLTFGKTQTITISEEGVRPILKFRKLDDGGMELKSHWHSKSELPLFAKSSIWLLQDNEILKPVAVGLPAAYFMVMRTPITIPAAAVADFMRKELPMLAGYFACEGVDFEIPQDLPPPQTPRFHLVLEGSLSFLAARFVGPSDENRLRSHGFTGPDSKGEMALKGERNTLTFFATVLPKLEKEWKVEIGERFQHVTRNVERIEPRMAVKSFGETWFDLSCELGTSSGEQFSRSEISRLLESGQSHVKRPNGKIVVFDPAMLDDFNQLLRDTNPEQRTPGLFRLQKRQAGSIQAFAEDTGMNIQGDPSWQRWANATRNLEQLTPVPLGSLEETLRSYQKHGVYWLHFLAQNNFGGILADEMGLGKTLQALAFLRTLQGQGPSLIVCPSSLIFNWNAEALRWTPDLKIVVIEGPKRAEEISRIPTADLVITSYPLLRVDIEHHRQFTYAAVILDEAQNIKNPDSQNAQAATALRAKHKFVLTGTPVENSVRDLWSLMNFILPGYLGSRKEFKERYEGPISSQPDAPEQQRLSRRIAPFLLRRTKNLVAKELPEKLEQVVWCELAGPQREIYTKLAETTRRQLSELSGAADQKKSRMVMLTALLRLRQAACDARLLGMENPPEDAEASAKLDMLEELIQEAVDGGHRVLVFSQFVTMLGHIRSRLEAADITYCYLDGQSRDRAEQVQKFQAGQTPVFLISLKAGGTGLNLTAADTVIHFDPWWNPAVEAQATDRAHRIGQKKVVTSYKLIARGTVEEKILTLQAKKKSMIAATIESEQPMMDGLTLQEIQSLLE